MSPRDIARVCATRTLRAAIRAGFAVFHVVTDLSQLGRWSRLKRLRVGVTALVAFTVFFWLYATLHQSSVLASLHDRKYGRNQLNSFVLSDDHVQKIIDERVNAEVKQILRQRQKTDDDDDDDDDGDGGDWDGDGAGEASGRGRPAQRLESSSAVSTNDQFVTDIRQEKTYFVVHAVASQPKRTSKRTRRDSQGEPSTLKQGLVELSLQQLGYKETLSLTNPTLMWIVAPGLECEAEDVSQALNSLSSLDGIFLFCSGDANTVNHVGRKDVLDQRLRWLDTKFHRHSGCPLLDDFVPPTYVFNPMTDLKQLQHQLEMDGLDGQRDTTPFILKWQSPRPAVTISGGRHSSGSGSFSDQLPLVTHKLTSSLKKLQKHRGFEGAVVQKYATNPLLWMGRKFSIRTWAFVVQTEPLVALYHDGMITRSLEPYYFPHKGRSRFANITSTQPSHPDYETRKHDSFACLDDLQEYLSESLRSAEMKHYVDLILKPYMKRLMLFALLALLRERAKKSSFHVLQHVCFDFMLDGNWNVWLHDVNNRCTVQAGGKSFTSECKRKMVDALGASAIGVAEQISSKLNRGETENLLRDTQLGSFEVLVDETSTQGGSREHTISTVCRRDVYQRFRDRQTFNRRVVQLLFPADGRPATRDLKKLGYERSLYGNNQLKGWVCNTCGYENHASAKFCDMCGTGNGGGDGASTHAHRHSGAFGHDATVGVQGIDDQPEDQWASRKSAQQRAREEEGFVPEVTGKGVDALLRDEAFEQVATREQGRRVSCGGDDFVLERSVDVIGNDIEPLRANNDMSCCQLCASNPSCVAFTFVRGDYQCWLKSRGNPVGHKLGVVSGTRASEHLGGGVTGRSNQLRSSVPNTRNPVSLQHSTVVKQNYYRQQLTELFNQYDPTQLRRVDSLLLRYHGKEERLIAKTRQQYESLGQQQQRFSSSFRRSGGLASSGRVSEGVGETEQRQQQTDQFGITPQEYRERVVLLMQSHNSNQLDQVDKLMNKFKGREMELLKQLMKLYKDGGE